MVGFLLYSRNTVTNIHERSLAYDLLALRQSQSRIRWERVAIIRAVCLTKGTVVFHHTLSNGYAESQSD